MREFMYIPRYNTFDVDEKIEQQLKVYYNMYTSVLRLHVPKYNIYYIIIYTNRLAEMGVSARWIIALVNCFGSTNT